MTRLRPAMPEDAPALAAILQGWLDATPWMPDLHSLSGTDAFVARLIATTAVTVADTGVPAGFLCRDDTEIDALYVAEGARGSGIGAALLSAAQQARSELALWTFQANSGAQRFYARHGFHETRRTDGAGNDEKLPDIRLQWSRP